MPEPMKKRPTDAVVLNLKGPASCREEALRVLAGLGFSETSELIPWRSAFPGYEERLIPGIALKGARGKEGITQALLAEATGIPQRHISEMENGKRTIGRQTAQKLAKALNVSYKIFL